MLSLPAALRAQRGAFPSRPITLWVPWPAGGGTDLSLRVLADIASRYLGQNVHIENRAGAGGSLVMPILQQAEPDGHTIGQLSQPVLRVPYTQKVLWDPVRDLTPIIQLTGTSFCLLVPGDSPFRSLDDLFAWAKLNPGQLTIATNGVGTTPHVVLEELFTARGLKYIHVPYKGAADQTIALEAGQIMAGVNSSGFNGAVELGRLRMLVTFAGRRIRRWPLVPTLRDLGFDISAMSPYGLVGPRGVPAPVVQALHDAFRAALFDDAFVTELAKYDQEPDYAGPADYARWIREQYAKERDVVTRMGLLRGGS
jgi:tripartite-type tricarboxylate transporter receptor subunit TctC